MRDFPPGTDMMGTTRNEQYAEERLDFLFYSKLKAFIADDD